VAAYPSALIVLDTSVVVSALVGPADTPHDRLMDRVASGEVLLAISDEFLRELSRVAGYPGVEPQISSAARALRYGLNLGTMGLMHRPTRYDWPSVKDPKDGWMLDLAWASGADYIVSRDPHLTDAKMPFPVEVLDPRELLARLPY
jgi:putative PIN family toxin of toxin-antitoxin system